MKPETFYRGLEVCMYICCCPLYVVTWVRNIWSDRKKRIKYRRQKKVYTCRLGGWGKLETRPLPPRPKRKASVLSLEEGCSDLAYPVPSSASKILSIGGKRGKEDAQTIPRDRNNALSLTKLPYEIRMMIYQEVLGGHMFHMVTEARTKKKRGKVKPTHLRVVGHIICTACDCCFCFYDRSSVDEWDGGGVELKDTCLCEKWEWPGFRKPKRDTAGNIIADRKPDRGLLSLLKTCRQVYSECIGIIYSSNSFQFPNLGVLFAFKTSIPPQRQAAIRSIQIRRFYFASSFKSFGASNETGLRIPHGKNVWWNIIMGDSDGVQNNHPMTSLSEIRIVIPQHRVAVAYEGRETIFDPIADLVNAVGKVQGSVGSHSVPTVVVDFPVLVDKDHPQMAEVLKRAPFLRFRTPRSPEQIPTGGTGRKRRMWYV